MLPCPLVGVPRWAVKAAERPNWTVEMVAYGEDLSCVIADSTVKRRRLQKYQSKSGKYFNGTRGSPNSETC